MYLDKIIEHKRGEIKTIKPLSYERTREYFDPVQSLSLRPFIAEVKKASPSAGDINPAADERVISRKYDDGGAGAVSVLTDEKFFKGRMDILKNVSESVDIPVLCKDFIISDIQIENAHRAGADFILLIAAALNEDELGALSERAASLGLKVLYEIHGTDEFKKIESLKPEMIGINSRDLKTFEISLNRAAEVIKSLHGNFLKIAESGINTTGDIHKLKAAGADAFLIGTALMKSPDPAGLLSEFYSALDEYVR